MRLFETTEQGSVEIVIDEDIQARQDELAKLHHPTERCFVATESNAISLGSRNQHQAGNHVRTS